MNRADQIDQERRLRQAVLAGDELAWRAWHDAAFDGLLAYVTWRFGGRRDLVDDLVQETWLIAVRQIRKFNPEQGSFADWLRGVAGNLIRNHVRREITDRKRRQALADDATIAAGDEAALREERSARITAALAQLPDHYEAILSAKYLEGLSVSAIAERRNESPSAVESTLSRAREAFRRLYRDPLAVDDAGAVHAPTNQHAIQSPTKSRHVAPKDER